MREGEGLCLYKLDILRNSTYELSNSPKFNNYYPNVFWFNGILSLKDFYF